MTTTWRELISQEMLRRSDDWSCVVDCTLTKNELDQKFDNGFGLTEGKPFTLWTTYYVYFPVNYDGAEWCASVSRNPDGQPTDHVGGG